MVLKSSHKKIITLGLIQTKVGPDVAKNLSHTLALIIKAAKQGAQIVCLQELFLSPYFCQGPKNKQFFNLAETIPGPTTEVLAKIAKQYRLVIICSLYEKTQKKEYYNSVAVIGTQGEIIGTYRKMHMAKQVYLRRYILLSQAQGTENRGKWNLSPGTRRNHSWKRSSLIEI
jgi:N-carbamoylputrescine amidase